MPQNQVVEQMLRCTLAALIELAGPKLPPTVKAHPEVQLVPVQQLAGFVDAYSAFLRKY